MSNLLFIYFSNFIINSSACISFLATMSKPFSQLAVVGDQIFTDILGANLCGVKSIYVRPIQYEKKGFLKVKRWLERPFLPKV